MENLVPVVCVPFVILLWAGVTGLISVIGGWRWLAESNPVPHALTDTPETYSFQSLRLGMWCSYNSSMNIAVYRLGIRMQPIIFFRLFHKPIYLRYDAMSDVSYGRFIFHYMAFTLGGRKIMVMGRCVPAIKERISFTVVSRLR